MLNIIQSTAAYERWLGGIVEPVAEDTRLKHEVMRKDAFTFFRATFYCWARLWQRLPEPIAAAPSVLGIGDCHVENFGTWRDREGRLIWGVNDFDEAALLPYTNDLLRLAVSALLARERGRLRTTPHNILAALSLGYAAGLEHGGSPFVIEERNSWLRQLAQRNLRAPDQYWAKLNALEPWPDPVPTTAAKFLHDVPRRAELIKVVHRVSGAGSLGRPRLAALFTWRGGYLAREVKALVPSAWVWARLGAHCRAEERAATSLEARRPLPRSFPQGRTSLDRAQAGPRLLANRSVATAEQKTGNRIAPSDGLGDRQHPLWIAQRQRGAPASDRVARPLACRRE